MTLFKLFPMRQTFQTSENEGHDEDSPPSPTQHFYLSVMAVVLSCAALFMASKAYLLPQQKFVVVDMNYLLHQKAAFLMNEKSGEEGKWEMQLAQQAKGIRQVIEHYAADNNVIVVSKGAVFSKEIEEVTDAINING